MINLEDKKRTFGEGFIAGILATIITALIVAMCVSCTEYECVTPIPEDNADTADKVEFHPKEGSNVWIGGTVYPVTYMAGRASIVTTGRNIPRVPWFLHPAEVVTGMSVRRGYPIYTLPRVQEGDHPDIMYGQYLLEFTTLRPQTVRYYPQTTADYDSVVVRTSRQCVGSKDMGCNALVYGTWSYSAVLVGSGWLTLFADCGTIAAEVWKNGEIIETL